MSAGEQPDAALWGKPIRCANSAVPQADYWLWLDDAARSGRPPSGLKRLLAEAAAGLGAASDGNDLSLLVAQAFPDASVRSPSEGAETAR